MIKRYSLIHQGLVLSALWSCSAQPPKTEIPPADLKTTEKQTEKNQATAQQDNEIKANPNTEALTQSYTELVQAQQEIYAGNIDQAIKMLKVIVQRNPEIAEAHYNLGILEERLGVFAEARNHYLKAIDAKKDFSPAWLALSMLYFKNNDFTGALSELESKRQADPGNIGIRNARIRVLLNFPGKEEEIIQEAKLILREDEQNVDAMLSLASAYEAQKKHELAISILENAKFLAPNHPEVFARLSRSYESLGESLKARLILEEAVNSTAGGTAEIHNQLGLIYHAAGDYIGASDQFQRALSLWPTMIEAQINLGNSLKGQQKYIEASQAFQQALLIKPGLPEAYYNLGILYLDGKFENIPNKVDQLDQAIAYLNDYLKNPKDQDQAQILALIKEGERLKEVEKKKQEQAKPSAESNGNSDPTPSVETVNSATETTTTPTAESNKANTDTTPTAEPNKANTDTTPTAEPNKANTDTTPTAEPNKANTDNDASKPKADAIPSNESKGNIDTLSPAKSNQSPNETTKSNPSDTVVEEVLGDEPQAPTKPKEENKKESPSNIDKIEDSNSPKSEPKKEEVQDVEL